MKKLTLTAILMLGMMSCEKEELHADRCVYKDTIKLFGTGFRDFIPHDSNRMLGDTIHRLNSDGGRQNWLVTELKVCYDK